MAIKVYFFYLHKTLLMIRCSKCVLTSIEASRAKQAFLLRIGSQRQMLFIFKGRGLHQTTSPLPQCCCVSAGGSVDLGAVQEVGGLIHLNNGIIYLILMKYLYFCMFEKNKLEKYSSKNISQLECYIIPE